MKRFRALLLDSMNSRSAAGRSTKFQLTDYKITVAQKEKNKNKTFCPVISSVIFQGNNLAKALEENQRMVQLFPQVMLHTLPKYPAYIFTCLFPQDRSSKQVKHLSLRPETSTYKGKVGFIQLLCQYLPLSFSHSNESALKNLHFNLRYIHPKAFLVQLEGVQLIFLPKTGRVSVWWQCSKAAHQRSQRLCRKGEKNQPK